jgi:hypothetical protein
MKTLKTVQINTRTAPTTPAMLSISFFFFSAFAAHLAGTQYTKAASATKGGASRVAPKQRNQKPKKRGK